MIPPDWFYFIFGVLCVSCLWCFVCIVCFPRKCYSLAAYLCRLLTATFPVYTLSCVCSTIWNWHSALFLFHCSRLLCVCSWLWFIRQMHGEHCTNSISSLFKLCQWVDCVVFTSSIAFVLFLSDGVWKCILVSTVYHLNSLFIQFIVYVFNSPNDS